MLISVEELKDHPVSFAETFPADALNYHTEDFHQIGSLKVRGEAELVIDEIRVRGRLSGKLESTCDRCLLPVELPVQGEFDLTYRPVESIASEGEVEVPADELEIGFYTGAGIELEDVVVEQVTLLMPMKVVCTPDCLGLCPTCGANRNLNPCACSQAPQKSPFSILLEGPKGPHAS